MADKQEQTAQDRQELLEQFLKDNQINVTILFVSPNNSGVWLADAIKDDYKKWQAQIKVTND